MRILILGAGASKDGGYPLASELLPELKKHATRSSWEQSWKDWEDSLDHLPEELEVIRGCANPEVALSLVDLFDIAAEQQDGYRWRAAGMAFEETGSFSREELQRYHDSPSRELAWKMREGLARLRMALDGFFGDRHADDCYRRPAASRDYLRKWLAVLSKGDVVLTFNWDTVTERVLQEDGRWSPCDGYGFERNLEIDSPGSARGPYVSRPSEVLVLKLHGSFGWRRLPGTFFLDQASFLNHFEFRRGADPVSLRDAAEPQPYWPSDQIWAYPSFLKRIDHPVIQMIWSRAAEFMGEAEQLDVIGYSLPQSDWAARTLLLPLAQRCRAGTVKVVVRDPSREVLARWRELFGEEAEYLQERA